MSDSKKSQLIFRNTLLLYFRLLITMGVSLITSRIVLVTLGISDYGIYNIVGGVVVLFSFLNNAMSNATQRFLNFEIGKKDTYQLKKVFSASINVHIILAIVILIFAETIGLWLVNSKINLPPERIYVANWVYQISIITFLIGIIQVPFNAIIIAHERMSFYAYISIIEVFLKLISVILLQYVLFDKLKLYSILICVVTILIFTTYFFYCYRSFRSSRYYYFWETKLYKQLLSFSGWSIFGSLANIGKSQLINILLNIFCGVRVNAAMGISNQVSNAVYSFVSNFQTAFNPQIVKSYASNERDYLNVLVFQTSKFSFFLTFILGFPILISTRLLLELWLKTVPDYTTQLCQLSIISIIIEAISGPIWMTVNATGKIKAYQLVMSSLVILNVPLAYILLKFGYLPYYVVWVNIGISIIALFTRLYFVKKLVDFPVYLYIKEVLFVLLLSTIIALPIPFTVKILMGDSIAGFICTTIVSICSVLASVYYVGLKSNERNYIIKKIKNIVLKMSNRNSR